MLFINSFNEISSSIDTLFLDMFGVLWDGEKFYPHVLQTLENLKKSGKKICILSNMTNLSSAFIESKEKEGLIKGTHFDDVITSGDVMLAEIKNNLFERVIGKSNYLIYNVGALNKDLFNGLEDHITQDLSKADGVYASSLNISNIQEIKSIALEISKYQLPMFCANPDVFFMKKNEKLPAQGALAKMYQELGGTVFYVGKPYPQIFETALQRTGAEKEKTLMVGDMLETDVQGGQNAGIKTLLIVKTGIIAHQIKQGQTLENILLQSPVTPNYIKNTFSDENFETSMR